MGRHSIVSITFPILYVLLSVLLSGSQLSMCLKEETQALLDFRKQLVDPLNFLESWKDSDSDSPCEFYGVVCDLETGLVTQISLDNKSLSGLISPSLSVLKNLTSLALPSNLLSGSLPGDLSKCINLKVLNISDNYLNGSIPDLSELKRLELLDLADNDFSGAFPSWVENLTGLTSLSLGDNGFDEGEIPDGLGKLKKLKYLYLADSNLRGEIPESIFELEALGTLDICKNKISGKFPTSISKLKNLVKIELYQNNLTGEIPPELANLNLLEEFDISSNQMYGTIPLEIGSLIKLTVFHLFKNNFSGQIPPAFGDMQHLIAFSVYRNSFTGEFPKNMGFFSQLNSIDISENMFSGPFPEYLCHNRNLQYLLALENNFSGVFPGTYAECGTLRRLRINRNRLEGTIPNGIWGLPNVEVMDFSENHFIGGVSPGIEYAVQLNELMLSKNQFSGELPKEFGKLTQLERIYLDSNNFSGSIPSEIGALNQISSLHFEENKLSGPIPSELCNCTRLVDLNLASNYLSGDIPSGFSRMGSLNSLNLSGNTLTGPIPPDFDKLKLSSVDLSDNNLFGSIPPYFLSVAGDKALFGNRGLCVVADDRSSRKLISPELAPCGGQNSHHRNILQSKIFLSSLITLVLAASLCGLLLLHFRNMRQRESDERLADEKGVGTQWKLENFRKVEFDVDEICDLDEDNLIGSGSTGKVYRVDLKKGFGTLAVKQLWKENGLKLMTTEMDILGKMRHRNILKLYACLMKEGSNYLVLEYMSNGNLFQALHREIKSARPELDWYQRYRIALGAAKGIAYLHHDCNPPVIHRDIKSTNILLDEDYEAKIADFGVAKVVDQASPTGSESSCFAGTYGYIAPEMAYSLKVTEKNDVYSFGVVLMELVTGRRPIEDEYGDGKDLVYWVSTLTNSRENMVKLLDQKLCSDAVQEDMIKVLKLGIICTAKLPNLRPSMRDVVKMLIDAEPYTLRSPSQLERNIKALL